MQRLVQRNVVPTIRRFNRLNQMTFHSESESTASPAMIEDYRDWRAMGEGGSAPNWRGYLSQLSVEKTIAFHDTTSPEIYQRPEKYATGWSKASAAQRGAAQKSFLKEPLPQRRGPRSKAKRYVYPQRENNAADYQDPEIKKAWEIAFSKLGETNSSSTEWKTSALEKHGTALFLKRSMPLSPLASPTQREICHIHTSDMSGHVTLSFLDAQEVIAKGWGERHRMSGTDWIPLGYTMVYVPRSVEETEVLSRIFQAGVDFMKSG